MVMHVVKSSKSAEIFLLLFDARMQGTDAACCNCCKIVCSFSLPCLEVNGRNIIFMMKSCGRISE